MQKHLQIEVLVIVNEGQLRWCQKIGSLGIGSLGLALKNLTYKFAKHCEIRYRPHIIFIPLWRVLT